MRQPLPAFLAGSIARMPTIHRFANCKIAIYADDHMPPHFHIEVRTFRAVVEIDALRVRAGSVRHVPDCHRW
jgi:hypothetical protein